MDIDHPTFEAGRRAQGLHATRPTDFTKALRTNLLWQVVRFVVINLKMVRVIRKSHG